MKTKDNILELKTRWHNASRSQPRVPEEYLDDFKYRAVDDVAAALEASISEFFVQGYGLRKVSDNPVIGDYEFPYIETLHNLRATETATGQRGLFRIEDACFERPGFLNAQFIGTTPASYDFMNRRAKDARRLNRELDNIRRQFLSRPAFEPAEYKITWDMGETLGAFKHWMIRPYMKDTRSSSSLPAIETRIGDLADRIALNSADAARVIRHQAAHFVESLPMVRNPGLFLRKINDERKAQSARGDLEKFGPASLSYLLFETV